MQDTQWSLTDCPSHTVLSCIMDSTRRWWYNQSVQHLFSPITFLWQEAVHIRCSWAKLSLSTGFQTIQGIPAWHVPVPLRRLHRLPAEGQSKQHAGLHQESQRLQRRRWLVSFPVYMPLKWTILKSFHSSLYKKFGLKFKSFRLRTKCILMNVKVSSNSAWYNI